MKSFFRKKEILQEAIKIVPRECFLEMAETDLDRRMIKYGNFSAMLSGKKYLVILIYRNTKGVPKMKAEYFTKEEFKKYFELPEERKVVGELQ